MHDPRPGPEYLQIECRGEGPAVVVRAVGEIDLRTAPLLREQLLAAEKVTRPASVVVDLREVTFFGARGVTALIDAGRRCHEHDSMLCVVGAPLVTRVLTVTKAVEELTLCPSISEALLAGKVDYLSNAFATSRDTCSRRQCGRWAMYDADRDAAEVLRTPSRRQ